VQDYLFLFLFFFNNRPDGLRIWFSGLNPKQAHQFASKMRINKTKKYGVKVLTDKAIFLIKPCVSPIPVKREIYQLYQLLIAESIFLFWSSLNLFYLLQFSGLIVTLSVHIYYQKDASLKSLTLQQLHQAC